MRQPQPDTPVTRPRKGTAKNGSSPGSMVGGKQLVKPVPMLATSGALPAHDEEYAFEIKWDGLRALAVIENGRLQLLSRNQKDITAQYPELAPLGSEFPSGSMILDGEIVVMDDAGRPDFGLLQQRMNVGNRIEVERRSREHPVTFLLFDILHLNGSATTLLPYIERRRILEGLELIGPAWNTPPHFTVEGSALLQACRHRRLEGVIAKRLDSPYAPGSRSRSWIKIKIRPRQELVVAGWVPGEGGRSGSIGSLLVGYYDISADEARRRGVPQRFVYAGKVGAGFTDPMLRSLDVQLQGLRRGTAPFTAGPPVAANAIYVEPVVVGEVEFAEWTRSGTLRQASFKGLRPDKDPAQVVRE